jgi:hypothetical protein
MKKAKFRGISIPATLGLFMSLSLLNPTSSALTISSIAISSGGVVQPTIRYSYIISVSGSNYQILDGDTKGILYQSSSSSQVINYLLGSSGIASDGSTIYVDDTVRPSASGWNVDASWVIRRNNIQMFFSPQALLKPRSFANEMSPYINVYGGGQPVLFLMGNGIYINGVTIDGNWLVQYPAPDQFIPAEPNWNSGIAVGGYPTNFGGTDCVIAYSKIYNCRRDGIFTVWQFNAPQSSVRNLLVENCEIYNISANGVSIGVGQYTHVNGYVINNHIHHCGDCAVDFSGDDSVFTGNYVHDIGPIIPHGYVDSGWAVCVEFGHGMENGMYEFIAGNRIINSIVGVCIQGIGTMHDVLVSGNIIDTCSESGIQMGAWGINPATNNIVEYNSLANCHDSGIMIGTQGNPSMAINNTVYGNVYSNCGTNFRNWGTGTVLTQPPVVATTVTSLPTGEGYITANGLAGYAGSYSTSPYVFYATVGSQVVLAATSTSFISWSDGGAQTHIIVVSASYQTYTATYS